MSDPKRPYTPGFIEPSLPTYSKSVPSGPEWVHELKHDGYRLIVRRAGDRVRLFTRRGHDWTERYPLVVEAALKLKTSSFMIDCEAVICDAQGKPDFDRLHSHCFDHEVTAYAFDLIELDALSTQQLPLDERKGLLRKLVGRSNTIRFNEHFDCEGEILFEQVCRLGLEGIVSKRRGSRYVSGRVKHWLKIKNPGSPSILRVQDGTW